MDDSGFNFDNSYLKLPKCFYTLLEPVPVKAPKIVVLNEELAKTLGLDFSGLTPEAKVLLFSGNKLPKSAQTFAQAYAGHQYGHFTMLGDGRAIILGEHITPDKKRFDIQYKGSGPTPYSRGGDGRAAISPMLREYLVSEAMYHLCIPTTRSLAVIVTGEQVYRETPLSGAILTRVASSHIRIGTFEFAAAQGDKNLLKTLLDYTVQRHFPELVESDSKAIGLLKAVMIKQIDLIVDWMRVGFIHGVMNTDNMALSGETIDYGPCAFMDEYDSDTVFSSIDRYGRYSYSNQPKIAQWNLARLAEAMLPLIHEDLNIAIELSESVINEFSLIYKDKWLSMMRSKLGLTGEIKGDETLISDLLDLMQKNKADYINTFLDLSQENKPKGKFYEQTCFNSWYQKWQVMLKLNSNNIKSSLSLMRKTNPAVIPRNHKVEEVLSAANEDDFQPLKEMLEVLKDPYNEQEFYKPYQSPPLGEQRVYQTFCGT